MRCPGIEPESQEWESCMIPLHQQRKLEMPGIEPGAFHMRSERSTTEPHPLCHCNEIRIRLIHSSSETHSLSFKWKHLG